MAAPDPNARSTGGKRSPEDEVDEVKDLIEKCLQLYMNREETAAGLENAFGISRDLTHLVWDALEKSNPEFFQNYYTRLVLKQQIIRFNELLMQQFRALNFPVPVEQQTSMELAESAPQADSPVSETSNNNEAESSKPPANPVDIFGSEEVTGQDPNSVLGGSLHWSSMGGQGIRRNAALDTAHMPISHPNLIAGGDHTANFRQPVQSSPVMTRRFNQHPIAGAALDTAHMPISPPNLITGGDYTANFWQPVQSSPVMTRRLSQLDPNPGVSNQKDHANFTSIQGFQSAHR